MEKVILVIADYIIVQAYVGGKSVGARGYKKIGAWSSGGVRCDMIKSRTLRTRAIKLLILDESDEMLSRGFKDQIYDVYRYLPPELQEPSYSLSQLFIYYIISSLCKAPRHNMRLKLFIMCLVPAAMLLVLISAILPNEILEITSKFMTDPVCILVKRDELTLEISQITPTAYRDANLYGNS